MSGFYLFLACWWLVGFLGWCWLLRRCGVSRWWLDLASGVLVVGWMGVFVWLWIVSDWWVFRDRPFHRSAWRW